MLALIMDFIILDNQATNRSIMKQLILIQNDYSGAGKSTLAECLHLYLENLRVPQSPLHHE